jgi:monofunctional chorismate mutase
MLPPELQSLRTEIDEIDEKLVDLLASRFRLTSQVGRLKALHGLEAVDPEREAAQAKRFRELAQRRDLNPDLVNRVFRSVIDEVVKNHKEEAVARSSSGDAVRIRPIEPTEVEQARALLARNAWGPRVADPAVFADLVARSQLALVAVEGTRVIGFLRGLSDGIFNGYISMVVVAEDHRGRGVGTRLLRAAMGDNRKMTWVLRAGRGGVSAFYEKLGFCVSQVAMERPGERT